MHCVLPQVVGHSELLELRRIADHVLLVLFETIPFRIVDLEWHLIGVIVSDDKSVIEEESRVAFLPVGIKDLLIPAHVMERLDHETFLLV